MFELEKTLKYKRGSFDERQRELLKLMTLIEGLDTPDTATARQPQHDLGGAAEAGGGGDAA